NYFEEYQGWLATVELNTRMTLMVIPEGYLNVNTGQLNSKDTIKVYLRSATAPYDKVDSAKGIVDSINFITKLYFCNVNHGNFYINVWQRNSIETWSSNPILIENNSNLSYDFTNSSSRAFGENQVLVQNKWCMFSGDTNSDGMIDATDIISIKNDASAFVSGYVVTDINGDGITDASDLLMTQNNNINFATIKAP
ncbi:MAG: dockerin type I domain-containing protein, partial [bacterium]